MSADTTDTTQGAEGLEAFSSDELDELSEMFADFKDDARCCPISGDAVHRLIKQARRTPTPPVAVTREDQLAFARSLSQLAGKWAALGSGPADIWIDILPLLTRLQSARSGEEERLRVLLSRAFSAGATWEGCDPPEHADQAALDYAAATQPDGGKG